MECGSDPANDDAGASGVAPRLHARALAILRHRIHGGAWRPGTKLMESPLAREFGISRAPVRRALQALAAEGLVRRAEGRGFVVETRSAPAPGTPVPPGEREPDVAALGARSSWKPIYDTVEKAIAERISVASWRIVEVDLARHHGVSRTIAREVMARLHQRGLVKRDDKARWYAPALTGDYISELYELRWTLEPLALEKASAHAPPALIDRMRRNLRDALARADALSGGDLDALEAELHVEFLGYCPNRTLLEGLLAYQSLLVAHTFLYAASASHFGREPFLPEHEAVIERLAAGRIPAAADAMAEHLRAARDRAIARVETVSRTLTVADLPYMKRLP